MIIACDIGGVIRNLVRLVPEEGALEGLATLQQQGHTVIFISKCGEGFKASTIEWLREHNLQHIPLHFCESYAGKIEIALKNNVQAMIDDKIQVLKTFPPSMLRLWFCYDQKKIDGTKKHQPELFEGLTLATTWQDIINACS